MKTLKKLYHCWWFPAFVAAPVVSGIIALITWGRQDASPTLLGHCVAWLLVMEFWGAFWSRVRWVAKDMLPIVEELAKSDPDVQRLLDAGMLPQEILALYSSSPFGDS